jgi:hypothetical protein
MLLPPAASGRTAVQTFRAGFWRVAHAPAVVAGVFALNLLIALPLAYVLRDSIAGFLGSSQRAEEAVREMNTDWWGEYQDYRRDGLGATFTPSVIGFAAVLRNASDLLDAQAPDARLVGPIVAWLLLWTFLAGGVITRYARDTASHAQGFFAACGHHLFRLLRLGAVFGLAYVVLFRYVHPLLFDTIYGRLTHNLSVERTAFVIRLALYVLFALLLAAVHLFADAARVRAVVEDRRSVIGAAIAGARLLVANWRPIAGLYALTCAALVVLWLLYALIAPGGRGGGAWVWLALLTGQLYLFGRLWLKLQLLASLVALYQADLGYQSDRGAETDTDAETSPVWPESPAADPLGTDPL